MGEEDRSLQVRRAGAADCGRLGELNAQLIKDEGHRNSMTAVELEARMREWLDGPYEAHLIVIDGDIVGYVLARRETAYVYIRQFFVLAAFRRQGVGRMAFEWMADHVWQGESPLRLDVLAGNERGLAFWRSLGFRDYCLTMERE